MTDPQRPQRPSHGSHRQPAPENRYRPEGEYRPRPGAAEQRAPRHREPVAAESPRVEEERTMPWYVEIPLVVLLTLGLIFLLQTFVGRVYLIPSASMEPTLHGCEDCNGDRIFVQKMSYYFSDPEPGDIIVFEGTPSWNTNYVSQRSDNPFVAGLQQIGSYVGLVAPDENNLVKRVVATGGQTVSCQAGDPAIMVDGEPIDQSYTLQPQANPVIGEDGSEACGGQYFGPVTVPEGNYFVMGDNRTNSADSRYHMGDEFQGTIPDENVRGKVSFIILPLTRIGPVGSPDIQPQQ